jgi:hypothetical protein
MTQVVLVIKSHARRAREVVATKSAIATATK